MFKDITCKSITSNHVCKCVFYCLPLDSMELPILSASLYTSYKPWIKIDVRRIKIVMFPTHLRALHYHISRAKYATVFMDTPMHTCMHNIVPLIFSWPFDVASISSRTAGEAPVMASRAACSKL